MSATAAAPTTGWTALADLPLRVDGYALEALHRRVTEDYTRLTTVVHLRGEGTEGVGEDTTYAPPDQHGFRAAGAVLPLAGAWTLRSFSAHLDGLDLFPTGPTYAGFRPFRRWAFESAALDLALRQCGLSLAAALGRAARPLTFVHSPAPGTPVTEVRARLARYPGLRLKVAPSADWDDATVVALAATGAVVVVDLKGQYPEGTPVRLAPDADLYGRVLRAFPDAWIEDPGVDARTAPVLRDHWGRITWDAPIGSVADIAARSPRPRMLNMKPSRFGTVRAVLEAYAHCAGEGIGLYGGGQVELGPGRAQAQLLAALYHPDAPNDLAPSTYNDRTLPPGLPSSPLPAPAPRPGFG